MKIAHLTPTIFSEKSVIGGGERYVYNLARALNTTAPAIRGEIHQEIFSIGPAREAFEWNSLPVRILKNHHPEGGVMQAASNDLWDALDGFDLVHIHQILTNFGAFVLSVAKTLGLPVVGTDLGAGENELLLEDKGLELCDGVLSISHYAKSLLCGQFSGSHEVLLGPVDTDFFSPDPTIFREPGSAICVSRILPHKGIDRLIRCLPEGIRLYVVGRPYHNDYLTLLKQLARGKDVVFVHKADDNDLLAYYRKSSIFLQASTHLDCYGNRVRKPELMGLTTLEAMACGLPVCLSDGGSLPELVEGTPFGKVFRSDDECAALIKEAFATKRSEDFPFRAHDHVRSHFSFPSVGEKILNFYQKILEQQEPADTP